MEQKYIEEIKKVLKHTAELNKCLYKLDNEQVERLFKENSEIVKESIGYFNYSEELLRKIIDNINENKIEKRPKFTQEQEDWICYQIGEWYLEWKDKIVDGAALHKLGIAKEHLKTILCDKEKFVDNDYFKKFEKQISLEDRKKLSPDCIREFLENPEIINKFEPK